MPTSHSKFCFIYCGSSARWLTGRVTSHRAYTVIFFPFSIDFAPVPGHHLQGTGLSLAQTLAHAMTPHAISLLGSIKVESNQWAFWKTGEHTKPLLNAQYGTSTKGPRKTPFEYFFSFGDSPI